ncbi:MAG: hypothetical protein ABI335_04860 [Polyangiaceae bacterium]
MTVALGSQSFHSFVTMVRGLLAKTLTGLAASAICTACGGHARTSSDADAAPSADATSDAEAGAFPLNAPRLRLACGGSSTCFLTAQGSVSCWGTDADGELGNGSIDYTVKGPAPVTLLSPAVGLIGGPLQTCTFSANDAAECWGLLPSLAATPTPMPTSLPLAAVATIALNVHDCAVTRAGDVYCWGADKFLGNGAGTSDSPVQVAGLHQAIDVAIATDSEVGSGVATLVVLADGSVVGWGHAHGPGLTTDSSSDQLTPIPMTGLSGMRQITLGSSHACALLENAEVACWGSNVGGRLGSSSPNTLVPQVVGGLSDVAEVRAGDAFTCARRTNGEVLCWGENTYQALARPQSTLFSRVPVNIDVPPVTDLAVGLGHACVLTRDVNVMCWGSNFSGQINASDQLTFGTPTMVSR